MIVAEEMEISVSLVLKFPGGLTAVTVPKQAELYDETGQNMPNKRCIRLSGVEDPNGKVTNGVRDLRQWVTDYVEEALIYTNAPASLELGGNNVGLTGGGGTGEWTKDVDAIPADPIAPFTMEGLRKAGLI
jgi:hypothetical protein